MQKESKAAISTNIPLTIISRGMSALPACKMGKFSDTDYTTDPRHRKSILGFFFMVYGGAVMTYSKKMKSVARSTTEAEYVGMGEATKGIKLFLYSFFS
jgi:hypothetical protein